MKTWSTFFIALLLLATACEHKETYKNAVSLPTDDSAFLALKDTAQAHLQIFIDSLNAHRTDTNYSFKAKSDFVENTSHEHMWSEIEGYKDDRFNGIFIDSGYVVKNIKSGDPVHLKPADVDDWIIYNQKTDTQTGYYSESYLRGKQK
jgi:uncharacterized protein YegJ (DUF2314 family)